MAGVDVDDPRLTAWLQAVDQRWREQGITDDLRAGLVDDLGSDLAHALETGASVEELTAVCPIDFADRMAATLGPAAGAEAESAPSLCYVSLVGTAALGMAVGVAFSWVVIYSLALRVDLSGPAEVWYVLGVHSLASVVTVVFACAAVGSRFRRDPTTPRTVAFLGPALLVAGLVSVWPTIGLASIFHHSANGAVVLLEVLLVGCFVVPAMLAARWLAVRRGGGGERAVRTSAATS